MLTQPDIAPPATRAGRTASHAATVMLALFVFAAIPSFSMAQGLDAAVLAELLREQQRTTPCRERQVGREAAAEIVRRLGDAQRGAIARVRVVMTQRTALREPAPLARGVSLSTLVRPALLALPPPAC